LRDLVTLNDLVIYLDGDQVTDDALLQLGGLGELTSLTFQYHQMTIKCLKVLATLKKVRSLKIGNNRPEVAIAAGTWLEEIHRLAPELTHLDAPPLASPDDYAPLKKFARLNSLTLAGPGVTEAVFASIPTPENLTNLGLVYCPNLEDAALAKLPPMPKLLRLSLQGSRRITRQGLANLPMRGTLERLLLAYTSIDDPAMGIVAEMKNLLELSLERSRITDAGLAPLAKLAKLRDLNLAGAKVTATGVTRLQQALPDCKIAWDGPAR
jgi:hypothetical protein